jgi:hypothetical protein
MDVIMKKLFIYICLTLASSYLSGTWAQVELIKIDDVSSLLDENYASKMNRNQRVTAKANQFLTTAQAYEKEIDNLKNSEGRIKKGDVRRNEKKRCNTIIKARPFVYDAYKFLYNTYSAQLNDWQADINHEEVSDLMSKAKVKYKEGRRFNRKSENTENTDKIVDFALLSSKQMNLAVANLTEAIRTAKKEHKKVEVSAVVEPTPKDTFKTIAIAAVDTIKVAAIAEEQKLPAVDTLATKSFIGAVVANIEQTASTTSADTTVIVAITPPVMPVQAVVTVNQPIATISRPPLTNVFISIQLLASKTAATKEQIKQVYSGSREVIEMQSTDYYRYVVGKFYTLDEAKSVMAAEGIKGLVVAFKDGERISITESMGLIK